MSTLIPSTPATNKSAEQHQEPSEQDSFNHLLCKILSLTSEQVQDLNGWMEHRGIPNVHEVIAQNFCKPHALEDNLMFITQGKTCYIQSNVMISLSLMISYIKHRQYSAKSKYFGPFYYIQIDPQDYDEWRTTPPEEEIHFQTPSKLGSPTTPQSNASSEVSESYITLTNFKKGIKHTGNSQYSRAEINRITKYLTNIKLDDTWRGTNESFLMHYNDQLRLLDSLVDSGEKLPDNARVTFLESAVESVPDL